jgi:nucleoside-triphosphatase THEP1
MIPKDKAKELFDKYYIVCQEFTEEIQCSIQAKQCAIIAVDEIIKELDSERVFERIDYWNEVKAELKKL